MGLKITAVLGVIFAAAFVALFLIPISMFDCSLGKESWVCLIVWIVLGIIFYGIYKERIVQLQISR